MSKEWIANQLILDSQQLLMRYRTMREEFERFQTARSKSFVDLLMAYETILKAILIHSDESDCDQDLHDKLKRWRHNVNRMVAALPDFVPEALKNKHPNELTESYFRVDLRYGIESYWFRDAHEQSFYETVSSSDWMNALESLIAEYQEWFTNRLNSGECVVSSEISIDALRTPEYNPYLDS